MAFCENCGTKLDDSARFCPTCGSEVDSSVPESRNYEAEFSAIKESVKETATKAFNGAQVIAGQVGQKIEEKRSAVSVQIQSASQPARPEYSQSSSGTTYNASATELWSWLKQSSKRQLFFTEEESIVTEEEFVQKIRQKMKDNGVPAHIESRTVRWDRSDVYRRHFFIRPITSVVNPLSSLVQFSHVGKFTFVEEKTFITPPNLPERPMTPVPVPEKSLGNSVAAFGVLIAFLGLCACFEYYLRDIGIVALLAGLFMAVVGYFMGAGYREAIAHNKKCEEQLRAWNKAWAEWKDSIFVHSFQEDTNGQLSRIFDSVYECIKQVSNEEFASVKSVEQEDTSNINDLEQLIARRKDEYR